MAEAESSMGREPQEAQTLRQARPVRALITRKLSTRRTLGESTARVSDWVGDSQRLDQQSADIPTCAAVDNGVLLCMEKDDQYPGNGTR